MARVRGKNTRPEIDLRRQLFKIGCRFRIHTRGVPGRPDVVHKGARVAVFVDGCFWHGCPKHYRAPRSHVGFWTKKLAYNVELRSRVLISLEDGGWQVLRFWECDIRDDVASAAGQVQAAILERRQLRSA